MKHTPKATSATSSNTPQGGARSVRRIGCVSYLNSKPLIEGLADRDDPAVHFDVPSRLLDMLLSGAVDIALCPVIDYFRSPQPLSIVPVGGICSRGATLTVRLFSQVPAEQIRTVHADTDSHTSVNLVRVLLAERYSVEPRMVDYNLHENHRSQTRPQTMLLIGDKVVTSAPPVEQYPYQIDLGRAWHELTDLPFVFATWMCRGGADLGDLPDVLAQQRVANRSDIDRIVAEHAPRCGWPVPLARRYLTEWLHFDIGSAELQAITQFGSLAAKHKLIEQVRPVNLLQHSPQ